MKEVKKCPRCGTIKPICEFGNSRREYDGHQCYCRLCFNDVVSKSQKKKRHELKEKIFDKLGHSCKCCGFSDKRALQFDHVNGDGYLDSRGTWQRGQIKYFKKILEDTSNSFQVLCANCNWIKRVENNEGVSRKSKQTLNICAS